MKLCELCGSRHESYQAHVFASNAASNKASNNASNAGVGAVISKMVERQAGGVCAGPGVGHYKKQRWSRESYNAYQREYMRRRRAKG